MKQHYNVLLEDEQLKWTGNIYIHSKLHVRIPITNQEIILAFKGDQFVHFNVIIFWLRNTCMNVDVHGFYPPY